VAAFQFSQYLTDVEFGNMLLIIGPFAFFNCIVLRGIQIPSVRRLEENSFSGCRQLEYAEFGVDLEYVGQRAFTDCPSLQRITVPLKDNITFDRGAFKCDNLTTVNLVGADELQKTISSLHMERWKNEINQEINRINRVLPGLEDWEKTSEIQEWLERVRRSFNRYKSEHQVIVKEAITLLELALWKAKLLEEKGEIEEANLEFQPKKKAKMDVDSARKALRITSGANVIIKNVLPFLKLA
jgi:archaellum component FlaC